MNWINAAAGALHGMTYDFTQRTIHDLQRMELADVLLMQERQEAMVMGVMQIATYNYAEDTGGEVVSDREWRGMK